MAENVGRADIELGLETAGFKAGLKTAESQVRATGTSVEQAFGVKTTGAIGKTTVAARGMGSEVDKVGRAATLFGVKGGQAFDGLTVKAGGFSGVMKNLGTGALGATGVGGFLGITAAAAGFVAILGAAKDAAMEEEASISRLNASLKANIVGFDGNTAAIEKTLASRMRLGFADDEQRESLVLLVAATKDETKALELQRTAMDLARIKKIDLRTASDALVKVEGGQYRMLKSLGIVLGENATATEALAAVQKVTAGQAEAFAATSEGRLLVSQVRVGEQLERLGYVIMPAFVAVMEAGATTVEGIAAAFTGLDQAMKSGEGLGAVIRGLGDFDRASALALSDFADFITFWDTFTPAAEDAARALARVAEDTRETTRGMVLQTASTLAAGAAPVTAGAGLMTSGIAPAIALAAQQATALAGMTPAQMADALRKGKGAMNGAAAALRLAFKTEIAPMKEIAILEGQLSGSEMQRGLNDKRPGVRAAAEAYRTETLERLRLLRDSVTPIAQATGAKVGTGIGSPANRASVSTNAGYLVKAARGALNVDFRPVGTASGLSYANGLLAAIAATRSAARRLAATVYDNLHTSSPAKEGPLSVDGGPGHWGVKVGQLFGQGMAANMPNVGAMLGGLPSGAKLTSGGIGQATAMITKSDRPGAMPTPGGGTVTIGAINVPVTFTNASPNDSNAVRHLGRLLGEEVRLQLIRTPGFFPTSGG
ncbi:MAG: hypothetical protein H0V50_02785 [Thermoleophilaceae bacterium]|nr:hypothetical protein [Thermoleophilaceae bacterium]